MTRPSASGRIAIVTDIMAPYRIPLLNAVSRELGHRLLVLFMGEQTSNRQWKSVTSQAAFEFAVIPGTDISPNSNLGFNRFWNPGMFSALARFDPATIVVGGYHHPTSYIVLAFAKLRRRQLVLWSESTAHDIRPSSWLRRIVKRWFLASCSAFVVPGVAAEEYLVSLGVERERIYRSPNSVDVERFMELSADAGTAASRTEFRRRHGLPEFLVLFVGRLSPEKGFPLVISTVEKLQKVGHDVGLIVLGDGDLRKTYEADVARRLEPGSTLFTGFVQQDDLPMYYSTADVLLVPSLSEPWGFVVQEAQACSLPVVCSRRVGAGYDLVEDGVTGFIRDDVDGCVSAIEGLIADPVERQKLGDRGRVRSEAFNPEAAAAGFVSLAEAADRKR